MDASGLPKACAIRSTSPSGYFEEAALNAARKMRFMPGKVRGGAPPTRWFCRPSLSGCADLIRVPTDQNAAA
ncbi:MAG: energy transducer TonB [Desulfovibrio sp.]|nr:energy transducer TonB [Desulfovibrio sp.]